MPAYEFTRLAVSLGDDGVLDVILNRPDVRNAIDSRTDEEYANCLEIAADDPQVRSVMIRGAGPVFSAGHDLKEIAQKRQAADEAGVPRARYEGAARSGTIMAPSWYFEKPLVAGVHGYVGPLAMGTILASADFVIAAESTRFSFEQGRGGLFPFGQYRLWMAQLPMRVVLKLYLTGGWFSAEQALAWQFVQRVVPAADMVAETRSWAAMLAMIEPEKYRRTKRGLHRLYEAMVGAPARGTEERPWEIFEGRADTGAKSTAAEFGVRTLTETRDAGFDPDLTRI